MDPSTNHGCPRSRTRRALQESCCSVLNSSNDQGPHHYNEPDADRTLATTLNTSCPSSCINTATCSWSWSEGQAQRFAKVPVVSEYVEANSHVSSHSHSECDTLQIGGYRTKTNLEVETREFLRTFRLRDGQWDDPIQDLRLAAEGESRAGPSNAEYPPRRPPGNSRDVAVESDGTGSCSLGAEGHERTETFVVIDIQHNTIVPDLTLPALPASSSHTDISSGSTARTKVFATYHPIFNSVPWEAVSSETPASTTQQQVAHQTFGLPRSEDHSRPSADETTVQQRRRCCIVRFWCASRDPRPRGNVPLATEERDPADHTQEQQQQQCQSSGSTLQVNGLEQGDEGLPSEQRQGPIAQDRAPTVDLNTNVSPGTAEDTNAVPSEVSEAQAAIQDQSTLDADDRKGWKAIQRLTSMFLCGADLPPIAPSSQGLPPPPLSNVDGSSYHENHNQDELCSTGTPTVYASSSDPHSRASMTAMAGEPPEDSSSTFTSSSSRIIFGRILLGLEEMLAMLSQLVRPDSRPRDASA